MTKKKLTQVRQGDVFLERCDKVDDSVMALVVQEHGRVVLAHGEATGHAHAIRGVDALLFERPKTKARFLRVLRETDLLHEEHAPIRLQPGDYHVVRQREYSPEEIRTVAD